MQQLRAGDIKQNIERVCVYASTRSIIRYVLLGLLYMQM